MGGAAKGIANTVGRIGSGVFTLGGSEIARNNLSRNNVIRQALNIPGTVLTGGQNGQDAMPGVFGGGAPNPYVAGPFSLDPAQMAADKAAISGEGQRQFDATNAFVGQDQTDRAAGRAKLAQALTQQGQDVFKQGLPGTMEDLNARGLLNGSGLGQEIARQQGNLATNIADQVGTMGANDIDLASQQRAGALQGLQGFQTGSLQRGLSLEDQINNANISKTIGQVFAPQAPTGKQNFGTVAQGVGALAPLAGYAMGGPAGGAAATVMSGANAGKKYGK